MPTSEGFTLEVAAIISIVIVALISLAVMLHRRKNPDPHQGV
jgi:hypothetical protein